MAGLRSFGTLTLIFCVLFQNIYSNPVNISTESVPQLFIQSAINSLNENSPTQHTYRGGNLISAQKLLEPNLLVYRLTLNLETVCDEGLTNCPREACAIDLKDRSGEIEIDLNSIQCMYLYPQSVQEDVQQVQPIDNYASDNAEENRSGLQNTLQLDHEVEAAADDQRTEADKPFIAVRAPNSNYCPGCPYELNPNLPGLTAFKAQALDMMDRLGQNDFKHKLIRILKVTRAVPPGSNVVKYRLLAEIGESNCLKTTLIDRSQCSLQGNIPVKVCLITFEERPWQQSDRQVVANNCTEGSDLDNEINAGLNPGLNGNSYLVGNSQPERVDSVQEVIGKTAHIDQLAQEGKIGTYDSLIDQILESPVADVTPEVNITEVPLFEGVLQRENVQPYVSNSRDNAHGTNEERVSVTEASFVKVELEREDDREQVPRFVDKQREFDEFLSDFDIPLRDPAVAVTEDNRQPVTEEMIRPQRVGEENAADNDSSSSEESSSLESSERREGTADLTRTKRALMKTSGTERTLVKQLAQKAVDTLDDIDRDDLKRVVRRVLDSKKQERDGILYHLIIEVALTDCREDDSENDGDCLDKTIGPMKICKVEIHTDEKDPLLSARVVKSECLKETAKGKHARNRRVPALGAPEAVSVDNEEVKNYTKLGFEKLSKTYEGTNEPFFIRPILATRQVVAGIAYRITVELGTSTCPKGEKENCQLQENSERKECEIKVWSRPWRTEPPEIEVTCNAKPRAKRALGGTGVPVSISTDDEDVQKYAIRGFEKFSETFEGPNELVLLGPINATKQIVAGTLYRINVRLGTTDCPKGKKENCQLLTDGETKECEVKAWIRLWLGAEGEDIQVSCPMNIRSKRGLKGKNYSQKMLQQATYLKNERLFNDFIIRYNKSYSSPLERKNRFKIFHQNMMMVQELQRNEQGTAVYGASMFADLTTEEFKKKHLGLKPELRLDNEIPIPMAEIPEIEIPDEYDWRNYNVVTPVKNQGSCGSCWAFSVTGNVEGQYALRHKTLLSLSEQELVDCDTLDEGCNGGLPDNAYRAIEKLGGLELESDYPYDGENEACHFNKTEARVKVVSAVNITSNETQMAQWLVQNGPISIGINANAMQFYMGGVSHPFKFLCSPTNLDHGVLIVGYGTHTYPIFHKTLPYWTIKNSWGPLWGEQGYYRVYRGDGTCGVNQMASSAIVA